MAKAKKKLSFDEFWRRRHRLTLDGFQENIKKISNRDLGKVARRCRELPKSRFAIVWLEHFCRDLPMPK